MKYLCVITISIIFSFQFIDCLNEAQIRNAVKLVRNVCQPKLKVTNAQIDEMHKGNFPDDNKVACYMSCSLHALKFMKNGKMDYDFGMSQIKSLPPDWQAPVTNMIDSCKTAAKSSDKCEAAYEIAQCMYQAEPEYYFLP